MKNKKQRFPLKTLVVLLLGTTASGGALAAYEYRIPTKGVKAKIVVGVPKFEAVAGTLAIHSTGTANVGVLASPAVVLAFQNTGTGVGEFSIPAFEGANPGDFSTAGSACPSVAVNESCEVTVKFTPTADGPRSSTLTLNNEFYVFNGTGVGTPAFSVTSAPSSPHNFSDTTIDGTSSTPAVLTLKNTGSKQGSFTVPALAGPNSNDFSTASTCSNVGIDQECTISVSFKPKSVAALSATLAVNGTDYIFNGTGVKYAVASNNGVRTWADGTVANSCNSYMLGDARHGYTGATGDGIYRVQPPAKGVLTVYCDMTTDGGGWSLVAVSSSNSIAHLNAGAVGTITGPNLTSVAPVAKLSDADINAIPKTYYRMTGGAGATYKGYFDGTTAFTSTPNGSAGSMPTTRTFALPVDTPLPASPAWSAVYTQAPSQAGITSSDTAGVSQNGGSGAIYGAAPVIAADYLGSAFVDTAWMTGFPDNNVAWDRSPFTRGTHHQGTGVNIWVK